MSNYLDETGLARLWEKIKGYAFPKNELTDYIVDQGTILMQSDTSWEYVKRSSGFMELKGYRDTTYIQSDWRSWGTNSGWYIAGVNGRTFPFTFKTLIDASCHIYALDGSASLMNGDLYSTGAHPTNTQTGDYFISRVGLPSATSVKVRVFYEAFGTWK